MFMRHLLIISLIALTSACGFHLRGQLPMSESANVIFIDAEESEFKRLLTDQLVGNGAKLVADSSAAKVSLKIRDLRLERLASTLDARGKANSYSLRFAVSYAVFDADNKSLQSNILSESRDYTFDAAQILQQEREEKDLTEDMRKELVVRLVRQLSVL